ncbi:SGNH/GDSL hydrolase family protein [Thermocatellispora tengchongensis]|uniref:SGNH/GDSL hydrolase family protein n=1 Tax=Thermocatellispora tengchongensis TaxID=1073253 RepID=UPI00363C7F37
MLVTLGDSVTLGIGDPEPGGGWRGWAPMLAGALAAPGGGAVELHNLAVSGALVRDVLGVQLPRAVGLRPALATVLVGVNDTLRGRFDLAGAADGLDRVIVGLREAGALVLTCTLPDPGLMLGVPEVVRRPLAHRMRALNGVLECLALRHGTVHVDLARHPALYDRSMWGVDRLHPGERGHRLLARLFATAFAEHGVPLRALPDPEPDRPPAGAWAGARWMATKGTGWLWRRSRDLLPDLARLVLAEWRHRVRPGGPAPDGGLRRELAALLCAACAARQGLGVVEP